ncbi:MAG TPA: PP2C family serine/threonine-protein phosphatase [Stellaceae bacterium]|nr:PP2C family serine/threonine-protein phosphatase [Stellaceae bacterium]
MTAGAALSSVAWRSASMSRRGPRHPMNEDSLLERPDAGLWVLSDGMGGHAAGKLASQTIVANLGALPIVDDIEVFSDAVHNDLITADRWLCRAAAKQGEATVIGATVVVLILREKQAACLWSGDSRAYLFRDGELHRMSRDHTALQEWHDQGGARTAAIPPAENILTSAVGSGDRLVIGRRNFTVFRGDRFLLCSDGVTKALSDTAIQRRLSGALGVAPQLLLDEAHAAGTNDDATAIVIDVGADR